MRRLILAALLVASPLASLAASPPMPSSIGSAAVGGSTNDPAGAVMWMGSPQNPCVIRSNGALLDVNGPYVFTASGGISAQPGVSFAEAIPGTAAAPTTPDGKPAQPPGTQVGVTSLPAPVVVQQAPKVAHLPLGEYLGDVLEYIATFFGTVISTLVVAWLSRVFKNAGIQVTDQLRDRLQELVVNGVNLAAAEAADKLKGKGEIDVKNQLLARTVTYVQDHGADTLKKLGVDPKDPKFVEAVQARIEAAVNNPATPTPPVLDGQKADSVAAPAKP